MQLKPVEQSDETLQELLWLAIKGRDFLDQSNLQDKLTEVQIEDAQNITATQIKEVIAAANLFVQRFLAARKLPENDPWEGLTLEGVNLLQI